MCMLWDMSGRVRIHLLNVLVHGSRWVSLWEVILCMGTMSWMFALEGEVVRESGRVAWETHCATSCVVEFSLHVQNVYKCGHEGLSLLVSGM